jgi:hypothetical protein
MNQRGAATLLVAALLALGSLLGLAVADLARVTVARTRAAAAADAAALAAVPLTFSSFGGSNDPREAAVRTAAGNGAELVECRCPVDRSWATRVAVTVVAIEVDLLLFPDRRVTAAAAAEFRPILLASE